MVKKDENPVEVKTIETNGDSNDVTPMVEVENKEEKLLTSQYLENLPNDAELKQTSELQSAFTTHLTKNFQITPNTKIRSTIPTGIDLLDVLMGGGAATGVVQFIGNPGSGKSALLAKIISAGQRKWPGKFNSIYADSEDSTTKDRLKDLGVTYPQLEPYNEITVESIFQMVEGMCTYKEQNPQYMDIPWVIAWDSIANTMTSEAYTEDDPNLTYAGFQKAKALSLYLPKYVPKLNKYNIALVCVNQLRDKIDMGIFKTPADLKFLGDKSIPGGKSLIFNSIQIIFLAPSGDCKGEYGFLGTKVSAKAIKNKLFSPNISTKLIFSFERGFSNFWTNYEMLKEYKRIEAGAWCKLKSCTEAGNFRQNQALEFYQTKPEFKKAFDNDVEEILKVEIIDKYKSTKANAVDNIS